MSTSDNDDVNEAKAIHPPPEECVDDVNDSNPDESFAVYLQHVNKQTSRMEALLNEIEPIASTPLPATPTPFDEPELETPPDQEEVDDVEVVGNGLPRETMAEENGIYSDKEEENSPQVDFGHLLHMLNEKLESTEADLSTDDAVEANSLKPERQRNDISMLNFEDFDEEKVLQKLEQLETKATSGQNLSDDSSSSIADEMDEAAAMAAIDEERIKLEEVMRVLQSEKLGHETVAATAIQSWFRAERVRKLFKDVLQQRVEEARNTRIMHRAGEIEEERRLLREAEAAEKQRVAEEKARLLHEKEEKERLKREEEEAREAEIQRKIEEEQRILREQREAEMRRIAEEEERKKEAEEQARREEEERFRIKEEEKAMELKRLREEEEERGRLAAEEKREIERQRLLKEAEDRARKEAEEEEKVRMEQERLENERKASEEAAASVYKVLHQAWLERYAFRAHSVMSSEGSQQIGKKQLRCCTKCSPRFVTKEGGARYLQAGELMSVFGVSALYELRRVTWRNLQAANVIAIACLSPCTMLTSLIISHCDYLSEPIVLSDLASLRHITISHCKLSHFAAQRLPALRYLDVRHNRISTLRHIAHLPNLIYFLAAYNNLLRLTLCSAAIYPSLIFTDLSHNQLVSIDGLAIAMPKLLHLDLTGNNLKNVGDEFEKLRFVMSLRIGSNSLTRIHDLNRNLLLIHLDLSKNRRLSDDGAADVIWLPHLRCFDCSISEISQLKAASENSLFSSKISKSTLVEELESIFDVVACYFLSHINRIATWSDADSAAIAELHNLLTDELCDSFVRNFEAVALAFLNPKLFESISTVGSTDLMVFRSFAEDEAVLASIEETGAALMHAAADNEDVSYGEKSPVDKKVEEERQQERVVDEIEPKAATVAEQVMREIRQIDHVVPIDNDDCIREEDDEELEASGSSSDGFETADEDMEQFLQDTMQLQEDDLDDDFKFFEKKSPTAAVVEDPRGGSSLASSRLSDAASATARTIEGSQVAAGGLASSRRATEIREDWGFRNDATALMMYKRARKFEKRKGGEKKAIKKLNPYDKLALARKLNRSSPVAYPLASTTLQQQQADPTAVNARTYEWVHSNIRQHERLPPLSPNAASTTRSKQLLSASSTGSSTNSSKKLPNLSQQQQRITRW